jgi:hypothetical protein
MRRLALLALAVVVAGCGGGSSPSSPSATSRATPQPSAALPANLVGTWSITITPAEQSAAEAVLGRSLEGNAGPWTLGFAPDGTYSLRHLEEGFVENGTASATGDQLALKVTQFLAGATCHGNFPVGSTQTYRYAVDAGTLTLSAVQSNCPDDVLVLGTRPLQRLN